MREIKFRVRFKDGSGWFYWEARSVFAPMNLVPLDEIDLNTFGQLTGLNDKDGKPVYEGDIVKAVFMNGAIQREGKVEFQETFFRFGYTAEDGLGYGFDPDDWIYEIIGNIYEGESAYVPTLEELIEACEKKFGNLILRKDGVWEVCDSRLNHNALIVDGTTPTGAVLRLYLALKAH
jgi:hypothetical protein